MSTWGYRQYYLHFVAPIHHLDTHSLSFRSQPQRKRQRRQQVSTDTFCVFPFWGRVRRPVVLLPGWVAVLFSCVGEVGGTNCCTKRAARAQPAARQPTTKGRAAPPATGFPAPQRNQGRLCSALLGVFPGTVCRGNPRTPCTGTEGRSAAAARLTALGYRNQSTVRRRRPILATGRFMRPLTRQNPHSGCSMLIGCDAHNQNTFRDPKKQKPPRPESG